MRHFSSIRFNFKHIVWLLFGLIYLQPKLKAQGDVQLWFYDSCKGEVIQNKFYLFSRDRESVEDTRTYESNDEYKVAEVPAGNYYAQVWLFRGGKKIMVQETIPIEVGQNGLQDTLSVSRILRVVSGIKYNTVFLNCEARCQGEEEELNENEVVRLRGKFNNGIPEKVSYFDEDGVITGSLWYVPGDVDFVKMAEYSKGKLIEYTIHKRINKKKIMEYVYDGDSTLIRSYETYSRQKGY